MTTLTSGATKIFLMRFSCVISLLFWVVVIVDARPPWGIYTNKKPKLSSNEQQEADQKMTTNDIPSLNYFQLQGLGEPIRVTLALVGQKWHEPAEGIDYAALKAGSGTAEWPFGQAPRYSDDVVQNIAQSMTILRYLGKKHKIYGDSIVEETHIDMLLDAFGDFNTKYVKLIYGDKCEQSALETFIANHLTPGESEKGRNGGVHFSFLERWLERNGGEFAVGNRLSIADVILYYATSRIIEREVFKKNNADFRKHFPLLSKHHDTFKGNDKVKAYLESDSRHYAQMNGNKYG